MSRPWVSTGDDIGTSSDKKDIFSDKIAMDEGNRFNGEHKGAAWKEKIKNHLITKAPDVMDVLEIIEASEDSTALLTDLARKVNLSPDNLKIPILS